MRGSTIAGRAMSSSQEVLIRRMIHLACFDCAFWACDVLIGLSTVVSCDFFERESCNSKLSLPTVSAHIPSLFAAPVLAAFRPEHLPYPSIAHSLATAVVQ